MKRGRDIPANQFFKRFYELDPEYVLAKYLEESAKLRSSVSVEVSRVGKSKPVKKEEKKSNTQGSLFDE